MLTIVFRKLLCCLLIPVLFITGTTLPKMATAQEFAATWMSLPVSRTVRVTAPAEKWTQLLRVKKQAIADLSSYEYRNNERWLTLNREDAALVPGLTSDQMTSIMRLPRKDVSMIFGRYVPQESRLVINVIKVEERPDGYIYVYQTNFTPYHGEHWALNRLFLTQSERADTSRAGRNPLEAFKQADRNDPTFQNIGWDGAMVAMGLAMKYFRASYSIISVQNLRMEQSKKTSGGFLRKKVTIKVDGYAAPTWFLGLPSTMQTWGTAAAICAAPVATTTDPFTGKIVSGSCPPDLVVYSGVSFDEVKGNTFPVAEEHVYHWEKTSSGWTVLAFTILIMVAAAFAGPAIFSAVTGGGAAGAGATAAAGISSVEAAAWAGAAYAGGSVLTTGGGPASLTDVKDGVFGGIGDGRLIPNSATSEQGKEAAEILVARHIDTAMDGTGACGSGSALCSTAQVNQLVTPDPTKVQFRGDQATLRARDLHCRKTLRLSGQALLDCIVPRHAPVAVPD